jgi:non-canonical purine NTP pyrophosphatase (RdgB/HAM1 family)
MDIDGAVFVVATRNAGKLLEFRSLLLPLQCKVLGLSDISLDAEIEESGSSFAENARLKAIGISRLTRFPVIADDSGLEVSALGGAPGIRSARYAGEGASDADRIQKLLREIQAAGGGREARFACALALAQDGILLREAEGACSGTIIDEPRGAFGFGYDPIFLFPTLGKTFAELNDGEKNQHSHRAKAVASLLRQLQTTPILNRKS